MAKVLSQARSITYFGVLRSISSWAKVSRELLTELARQGVKINICERRGFLFEKDFRLETELTEAITNRFDGSPILTFEHPRIYPYLPKECHCTGMLVYEFTHLPLFWVQAINRYLDLVLVPSRFCREVFVHSGVLASKVRVLRYGYNPRWYYPGQTPRIGDFRFLCVANPHKREGIDLLLDAFCLAFEDTDAVELVIKLTYLPKRPAKPFEMGGLEDLIRGHPRRLVRERVKLLTHRLSEEEMGNLYRQADAYVSFSRCEAFGLCFLEALACGLPVIGCAWSGPGDFLSEANASLLKYSLVPCCGEEYEMGKEEQMLALPDIEHGADLMRKIAAQGHTTRSVKLYPSQEYWHWSSVIRDASLI